MTIKFFYTPSDNSEVYKNITELHTLNDVHPVDGFDIETPVVKIGSLDYSLLKDVNYAYIPEFKRYYYVGVPTIGNNKTYFLPLDEDYLMSFKDQFMVLTAIIDKEETSNRLYINDGTFIHGEKNFTRVYNYTNGFNASPDNILICCGGE